MPAHVDCRQPRQTVADRMDVIRSYLDRPAVLDLGVVDAWQEKGPTRERLKHLPDLLFRRIAELKPDVLGVDLDQEGVDALNEQGYHALCEDVQTMDLGRRFDVIIAGEIIEHLENPGQFLRNMRRHLADDGVLFVSTPNPFYAKQGWKIWRYHRPSVHGDHTCWFDPVTLCQLMRRTGLEPIDAWWIQPEKDVVKTWRRFLRGYFSHSFMILARRSPADDDRTDAPSPAPGATAELH